MARSLPVSRVSLLGVLLCAPLSAQVTQRISLDSHGVQGNDTSRESSISADGRFVAFTSRASNLVSGDTNAYWDVFVRDRSTGVTERVSVSSSGRQASGAQGPSISADGRFVAFSGGSNLVPDDTNGCGDIFVHDRWTGRTERVSVDSSGVQANDWSPNASISADGRCVAFASRASNLVPADTNGFVDVFVHDRWNGTTTRVSVDSSGTEGNSDSGAMGCSISGDGRFVAFSSHATNLVSPSTHSCESMFVHDRRTGRTVLASVDSYGNQGIGANTFTWPAISADGRFVAFVSLAPNLVPGDTNGFSDVFVHSLETGRTERVSVSSTGAEGDSSSGAFNQPSISADGRFVAFVSYATNLVPGDSNGFSDVFVHDRVTGATTRVDLGPGGVQTNDDSSVWGPPSISADGRWVAFDSVATNLVPGDTNADIFLSQIEGGTSFASLCDPGVGGAIACPCSNPPSGIDRGCDNSAGTGGAALSASGGAILSSDTLVLEVDGELPGASSLVLQGAVSVSSGAVYGQGVRCVGGTLRRLFVKVAAGGSLTAPDFGAGDPTVSSRSAAKGDVIQPGESRWYFVSYRDPVVSGGCPATSTFNATQTGQITWSP